MIVVGAPCTASGKPESPQEARRRRRRRGRRRAWSAAPGRRRATRRRRRSTRRRWRGASVRSAIRCRAACATSSSRPSGRLFETKESAVMSSSGQPDAESPDRRARPHENRRRPSSPPIASRDSRATRRPFGCAAAAGDHTCGALDLASRKYQPQILSQRCARRSVRSFQAPPKASSVPTSRSKPDSGSAGAPAAVGRSVSLARAVRPASRRGRARARSPRTHRPGRSSRAGASLRARHRAPPAPGRRSGRRPRACAAASRERCRRS